jgi:3-oxoacyl-[acyl-carrier protein] reductase
MAEPRGNHQINAFPREGDGTSAAEALACRPNDGFSAARTPDVSTESGRRSALAACPAPDVLINNAGGLPRGWWVS